MRTDNEQRHDVSKAKKRWLRAPVMVTALLVATAAAVSLSTGSEAEAGDDISDRDGWLNDVEYFVGEDDTRDTIRTRLFAEIDEAQDRIYAAIAVLDDEELEEALIAAADRGVDVRVVADAMYEEEGDFETLVDHDDVNVRFGDGELSYLPEPNLSPILEYCDFDDEDKEHDHHRTCTQSDGELGNPLAQRPNNSNNMINRPAHYNLMSHTFFVIDATTVWNITAPMNDDQPLWLGFRAMSEELVNSYAREFRQMHGGVFSTTLSVYNGPLKSVTHQSPIRFTNRGKLRVRFNPQERLTKNIVDETYRARASVFVMTENLTNTDLIKALRYKRENGFDVRVLVGQDQAQNPQSLADDLDWLTPVTAPEEMGKLPTMMIFDSERDRNGNRQPRTVQVLSHEIWRAQPFERIQMSPNDRVRFYPSDTFADGVMWEIVEAGTGQNPAAEPFVETWNQMWSEAIGE